MYSYNIKNGRREDLSSKSISALVAIRHFWANSWTNCLTRTKKIVHIECGTPPEKVHTSNFIHKPSCMWRPYIVSHVSSCGLKTKRQSASNCADRCRLEG
jgi:hypothetical protein